MFKNLLRIFYFIIIILIIFVSYLSIFGIKTNKFNELIKSQIAKQDKRIDLKLQDVYFKLNIKERSFSLNSQDVDLLILKEKQKISNVNILIGLGILIKQENEIKKIIINSKENKIKDLFKFIRAYRLNLPALYLENITKKGDIVYDIIINFKKK